MQEQKLMKRRTFVLTAATAALPASLLTALPVRAQDSKGYRELKPPVPVDTPTGQIEVIEFFSYGCSHCKDFEPAFEAWAKAVPKDVVVRHVHVGWDKQFEPLQRLYYSLEALGKVDAVQAKVYTALQTEHKRLDQPDVLFPWIAQQGVDRAKFEQAYKSFGVANQIQRATGIQNAYQIEGTPGLGIGGRFSTDSGLAHGFDAMLKLTDTLIDRIRKNQ
jgi:thiol:disulfide interchange protein DsbA